jgi:uncharacterized protein
MVFLLLYFPTSPKISLEVEQELTYPLYDLEFDTGEVISPMIYSEKEWNSKYKYDNVVPEWL